MTKFILMLAAVFGLSVIAQAADLGSFSGGVCRRSCNSKEAS